MAKKQSGNLIGGWAFLIGLVLAVIFGLGLLTSPVWLTVLVIIGLIIGLLNIAAKEVNPFLMSGAVLIIAASLGKDALGVIPIVDGILDALLAIFVPATVIVAIKNVFSLARG